MKKLILAIYLLIAGALIFPAVSCEEPIVINSFQATPATINEGQSSTLQWSTSGVSRANLNAGIGDVVSSGTAIVTPSVTTKYVLTVVRGSEKVTREVTVTVNKETFAALQTPEQPDTVKESNIKWVPAVLRYDNLNNTTEDYLDDQVAVWHTYAKMAGSSSSATAFYTNSLRGGTITLGSAGAAVKSPLIILPVTRAWSA
jgi:hypothetical protein